MAPSTAGRPGGSKAVALMSEACGELGTEGKQACSRAAAAAKAEAGQACDQASNAGRACVKTSAAGGKACVKAAAGLNADVDKVPAALRSWWRLALSDKQLQKVVVALPRTAAAGRRQRWCAGCGGAEQW